MANRSRALVDLVIIPTLSKQKYNPIARVTKSIYRECFVPVEVDILEFMVQESKTVSFIPSFRKYVKADLSSDGVL